MDDRLKLDKQLCFPLYASSKEIVRLYRPFLEPLGLTYTQYIAMMVMWEQKKVNVKALGARLYLDSGTLTPLLKRLEGQGYVVRQRDVADERNVIVTITDKGEKLSEQAAEIPARIASCVPLSEDEAKKLYELLYRVLSSCQFTSANE